MMFLKIVVGIIAGLFLMALAFVGLLVMYGGRQCFNCGSRDIKHWNLTTGAIRCVCQHCGRQWDED